MKQVTPYYYIIKNIIEESSYPCDGWKTLLNSHLEVMYAIENCNYTMFEANFNDAEYFLYSSPEILEFGEEQGKKLAEFNLDNIPVDGTVYINIPDKLFDKYPQFFEIHIENYFNSSIFFKIFQKSKGIELNTDEWEFFKKVKNLIKDRCLEKFKEDFDLDNIESYCKNHFDCSTDDKLNYFISNRQSNLIGDFKSCWQLIIRFLDDPSDLIEFEVLKEIFSKKIDLILSFRRKREIIPILKNPLSECDDYLFIFSFDVFKTFIPELKNKNIEEMISLTYSVVNSEHYFRNVSYLLDVFLEKEDYTFDIKSLGIVFNRFLIDCLKEEDSNKLFFHWKSFLLDDIYNEYPLRKMILKFNKLAVKKYKYVYGNEILPELMYSIYWSLVLNLRRPRVSKRRMIDTWGYDVYEKRKEDIRSDIHDIYKFYINDEKIIDMFFNFLKNIGIQEEIYIEALKYHQINNNLSTLEFDEENNNEDDLDKI